MSSDIAEALQSARYNETVQVNVSDGENSREIVLVAGLDEENGGIQWNDCSSAGDRPDIVLQRHLRTKRWMFPMLNDHRRNELYDESIRRASQEVALRFSFSNQGEQSTSALSGLDIGSGTGLLAMMSAKHLKESLNDDSKNVRVTSLEMSSAMAKLAQLTVASNGLNDNVQVIEGHSCEIAPMEPKAQLCTSELLESGLLGEGWLPALRDAWERHLDPKAVVVPQRARVYAQVAEGDGLSKYWGPHHWLEDFPNDKSLRLCTSVSDNDVLLGGKGAMDGIQVPMHVSKLLAHGKDKVRILSDPIPILELDMSSKNSIPSADGQSQTKEFVPIASGRAQGVIFWWELDLFGDDLPSYSTEHRKGPWQDHWHQCIFVFTKEKGDCIKLVEGQPASLKAAHNDNRIFFSVNSSDKNGERDAKRPRPANESQQSLISPERAWQLNDLERTRVLRSGIHVALRKKGLDSIVLDLSDFSLCAMIAALLGAREVTSLETSSSVLPVSTARIAQIANGLPLNPEGPNNHNFQIVRCHPEQLTTEILGGEPASLVIAEPYYEILEGWHLQEALNYFYTLRALKKRGVIADDALSVPTYASVMVCAFESPDIGHAYKTCESSLRGFKHDVVNEHGRFSEHDITLPSWQYEISFLTDAFEVARIDYVNCQLLNDSILRKSPFKKEGTCHGMLVYIDYGIPSEDGETTILSTKGRSYHQAIRMLSSPVKIGLADMNDTKAFFCCKAMLRKPEGQQEDHQFELSIEKK